MKSPFPGMDPYLEAKWPEVHASLIVYARNQINQQLPADLQANIEENLAVRAANEHLYSIRPDIHLAEDEAFVPTPRAASGVALAEPLVVPRAKHPERHVEIVNQDGRVITAIEFLSPWNKIGERAREQYAPSKWISFPPASTWWRSIWFGKEVIFWPHRWGRFQGLSRRRI